MTTKRWLDEASDADDVTRDLLRAGLRAEPPAGAEERVWGGLLSALVPPLGPGGGTPAPPAPVGAAAGVKGLAALASLAKGFALGVGVSVAFAGGARLLERPSAKPASSAVAGPAPAARTADATAAPSPVAAPAVTLSLPALAAPAPNAPRLPFPADTAAVEPPGIGSVAAFPLPEPTPAARRSLLDEEARLLEKARGELRSGALTAAFATLEASRQKFSAPELYQEREALAIELLYRSGRPGAAAERARAFVARFPDSPHAARIRGFELSP